MKEVSLKISPMYQFAPPCPSGSSHDSVIEDVVKGYILFDAYQGAQQDDQFLSQSMDNERPMLTKFGVIIARKGIPKNPNQDPAALIIGITAGGPPADPYGTIDWLKVGIIYPEDLPAEETWYWISAEFPEDPVDLTTFHACAVAITDADYQGDENNYWLWGAREDNCGTTPPCAQAYHTQTGWNTLPDALCYYNCTEGEPNGCTDPIGSEGQEICGNPLYGQDPTHRYKCTNGQWVDQGYDENCVTGGCTNPTGIEGQEICGDASYGQDPTHRYKCTTGQWIDQGYDENCDTGECNCEEYDNQIDCEMAKDSHGHQCCWWYKKYFWEDSKCYPKEQNMLIDYLPFIAIGGLGGIALILLLTRRPAPRYMPMPTPYPPEYRR